MASLNATAIDNSTAASGPHVPREGTYTSDYIIPGVMIAAIFLINLLIFWLIHTKRRKLYAIEAKKKNDIMQDGIPQDGEVQESLIAKA